MKPEISFFLFYFFFYHSFIIKYNNDNTQKGKKINVNKLNNDVIQLDFKLLNIKWICPKHYFYNNKSQGSPFIRNASYQLSTLSYFTREYMCMMFIKSDIN